MIQRKQTLFMLLMAMLSIGLLFVPAQTVNTGLVRYEIALVPVQAGLSSTIVHYIAIVLNFIVLVTASITIFLYRRRQLQLLICNLLAVVWGVLCLLIAFGKFTEVAPDSRHEMGYLALVMSLGGGLAALFAARFIRKDIQLLRSADRIR